MLTTLLTIGSVLQEEPGVKGLKHHRYIRPIPQPQAKKGQSMTVLVVKVAPDMTFDLTQAEVLENENERQWLYYLNYKSSDADSMKKYVFGDICRFQVPIPRTDFFTEAEVNFVLGDPMNKAAGFRANSFQRGAEDASTLNSPEIQVFRTCLARQIDTLTSLCHEYPSLYINFRFGEAEYHWYELENVLPAINQKLLSQFVTEVPGQGFALAKALYKTLSASKGATPYFREEDAYKSWLFPTADTVMNLLYAVDFSQRAKIRKGDIKIVVLPRRDSPRLEATEITQFFSPIRQQGKDDIQAGAEQEQSLEPEIPFDEEDNDDQLISPLEHARHMITKGLSFDFVFSRASSSPSSPDVDVIEVSGLTHSRLSDLHRQLTEIRQDLMRRHLEYFTAKNITLKWRPRLFVLDCLNNIFREPGREKKKYASHLLKVVPQIYCGNYVEDDLLQTVFIETVERSIREGSPNYDFLRFDLLLLRILQDVNLNQGAVRSVEDVMQKIEETPSYQIGRRLGKIARPLRQKINSFEKNYVGLLSRRVAQLTDVVSFLNYMDQKLIMHEVAYQDLRQASREVTDLLRNFSNTYDRELCVLGFFDAYYEPIPRRTNTNDEQGTTREDDNESPVDIEEEM